MENTPEELEQMKKNNKEWEEQQHRLDEFEKELTGLINKYSLENISNTPDFILADYLRDCLEILDYAIRDREKWYGKKNKIQ